LAQGLEAAWAGGIEPQARAQTGTRQLRPLAEPAAKGSSGELAQARAKIAELDRRLTNTT